MLTNTELYHYGVLGMKWGVRRFQNKDGSLTSAGKKRRLTVEERKTNGRELREAVSKSSAGKMTNPPGIPPAMKDVWEKSSTMRKFAEATRDEYKKRNDIYDGVVDVPAYVKKKYSDSFGGDDLKYYGYGEEFKRIMRRKASEIVYDKKDVDLIMRLVEAADWYEITDTFNDGAWVYWH